MDENKILLNWDCDAEIYFFQSLNGDMSDLENKARAYLEAYYKDRGIGDILFNIFIQSSLTPSKVWTYIADKYGWKEENGVPVNYTSHVSIAPRYQASHVLEGGVTRVWIDHCKRIGIRPWISLRMNDMHGAKEPTFFWRSAFSLEARKKGWTLGDAYGSALHNLNYAVPEVRQKMLAYMKEQLDLLDVYGIELDFMREPKCVRYRHDENARQVMNEFVARVKETVSECAAKWGHPIKIAVRMPRDIDLCYRIGFDVECWAKHGLVDAVIPSPHWISFDTGMPIAEWTRRLAPYEVSVWAGIDMNMPAQRDISCVRKLPVNLEIAKAHTVQYAAQGSTRTYIFNLYNHIYADNMVNMGVWFETITPEEFGEIWVTAGDKEACAHGRRRHIVTMESPMFSDIADPPRWRPLPRVLGKGSEWQVQTGKFDEHAAVTVFVGADHVDPSMLRVFVNGKYCTYLGEGKDAYLCNNPEHNVQEMAAFSVPAHASFPLEQTVRIEGAPEAEIYYLEILIDAQ